MFCVDSDEDDPLGKKKSKRGVLPKHATQVMKSWLFQHIVVSIVYVASFNLHLFTIFCTLCNFWLLIIFCNFTKISKQNLKQFLNL